MPSRLQVLERESVGEAAAAPRPSEPTPPKTTRTEPPEDRGSAALAIALTVLQILSQRTVTWLGGHTLPLVILGMGFALWAKVLPQPSYEQLGALFLYGLFGLLVLLIRRK